MDWLQISSTVGPVVGVIVGAGLSRSSSREAFVRNTTIAEITTRRMGYTTYQKALWAYAGRVKTAIDLDVNRRRSPEPDKALLQYDLATTKERQEACRDAFADLTLFASTRIQDAARAGMVSLTAALEAVRAQEPEVAAERFADYEAAYTAFANGVNEDVTHVNALMYAFTTPLWRAVLGRAARRPLPFEVVLPPPDILILQADEGEEGMRTVP